MNRHLSLGNLPRSVSLARAHDGSATFTYLDERLLPRETRFE